MPSSTRQSRLKLPATPDNLNIFLAAYIQNGGNGVDAVISARPEYATNRRGAATISRYLLSTETAKQTLAKVHERSQLALARAMERYGVTADAAADELARLAFTEVRQVVSWRTEIDPKTKTARQIVRVKDDTDIDPDAHRAIVKVKQGAHGVEIELADKRAAIMDLARLKGWIQDTPAPVGNAVQFIVQR